MSRNRGRKVSKPRSTLHTPQHRPTSATVATANVATAKAEQRPARRVPAPATIHRPSGVTVLAVLSIISGVLGLIQVFGQSVALATTNSASKPTDAWSMFFDVASSIAFGAAYLGFGIGAWTLKPWAWVLGVIIGLVSIAYGLVAAVLSILRGASVLAEIFVVLFVVAFEGMILFYLFTRRVKRAFGRD